MLTSLGNLPKKSLIRTIQLQNRYCTQNERRERLLRIRNDQKQLYGRTILGKDHGEVSTAGSSGSTTSEMKVTTPKKASEFYWIIQDKINHDKNVQIFKLNKSQSNDDCSNKKPSIDTLPKNPSQISTNWNQNNSTDSNAVQTNEKTTKTTKNTVISAKSLLQKIRTNNMQAIPFDVDTLNSIVKYPLICDKCTLSETEELLANTSVRIPSISKVLQGTMPEASRMALKKWKLGKIAELGVDGFKQYEKETLDRGKEFHSAIEHYLSSGKVPDRNSNIIQLWESIDNSLNDLKPKAVLLEQPIVHAHLKYKGIIDNVSIVRDELCAFEWKTSEKLKPKLISTYDAPVQLCAYIGALNADPRYNLTVKNGRVIVAYKSGDTANVFHLSELDLRKYWLIWLQRLQEYWIRFRDGTLPDPI